MRVYEICVLSHTEIDPTKISEYDQYSEEEKCDYYPVRPCDALERGAHSFKNHWDGKTWTALFPDGHEEVIVNHYRDKRDGEEEELD